MTLLSYQQAINDLFDPVNATKYSTFDGLMELVNRVSIADPLGTAVDARTFTYSGRLTADAHTQQLMQYSDESLRER